MIVLMRAFAGLWLWSAGFALLYALHGAGCALGWTEVRIGPTSLHRLLLLGALALTLAPLVWLCWLWRAYPALPRLTHFYDWLAGVLAWTGLVAMIFSGLPAVVLSKCL